MSRGGVVTCVRLISHKRRVEANGLTGVYEMASIVAGFGVPHTPVFPFFVKRDGPELRNRQAVCGAEGTPGRRRVRTSS